MGIVHAFESAKGDGSDATLVQPSDWNADHTLKAVPFVASDGRLTAQVVVAEK